MNMYNKKIDTKCKNAIAHVYASEPVLRSAVVARSGETASELPEIDKEISEKLTQLKALELEALCCSGNMSTGLTGCEEGV